MQHLEFIVYIIIINYYEMYEQVLLRQKRVQKWLLGSFPKDEIVLTIHLVPPVLGCTLIAVCKSMHPFWELPH